MTEEAAICDGGIEPGGIDAPALRDPLVQQALRDQSGTEQGVAIEELGVGPHDPACSFRGWLELAPNFQLAHQGAIPVHPKSQQMWPMQHSEANPNPGG